MTTTSAPAPAKPSKKQRTKTKAAPSKPRNPVATKVNPMLIAAGIAVIIVGALAGWYVLNMQSTTASVVTVTQTVPRGTTITGDHLGTLEVGEAEAGQYISARDTSMVIGTTALTDLTAGTPLNDANTGELTTANAEAIVGVPLTTSQLPSTKIAAGDHVSVVSTAGNAVEASSTPMSIDATVFSIRSDSATGLTIVDLTINPDQARTVAAMAASGDVAVVLLESGRAQ